MDRIDATGLKRTLDEGRSATLLDVREPWEFEICHIAGSINIPMSQLMSRMDELDKAIPTIVICHHGARSFQVAGFLESCGFDRVFNLDGGVSGWAEQVDPLMPRY